MERAHHIHDRTSDTEANHGEQVALKTTCDSAKAEEYLSTESASLRGDMT